jgi:hypothetical protein
VGNACPDNTGCTAQCPSGKKAVGGGCTIATNGIQLWLEHSRLVGDNEWTCDYHVICPGGSCENLSLQVNATVHCIKQ